MINRDKFGRFIKTAKVENFEEKKVQPSFPSNPTYLLRTCNQNLKSHNGFQYPEKGYVEASDWKPEPICGFGLHGLLMGKGNPNLLSWNESARWQILAIEPETLVEIDKNKVKVPRAWVVLTGTRREATDFLLAHGAKTYEVPGAYFDLGNGETLFAGYKATITCGNYSEVTCGYGCTVTSRDGCTVTCGYGCTVTCGDNSEVTSGDDSKVTCGDYSKVTSGDDSTVTSGNRCTVICGNGSTVICGKNSLMSLYYYDSQNKLRVLSGRTDEELKPETRYRIQNEQFVEI